MSTKKPVVVESYDEIVFPEPSEGFFARVQSHPAVTLPRLPAGFTLPPGIYLIVFYFLWLFAFSLPHYTSFLCSYFTVPVEDASKRKRGDTKDHPLSQWFMNFSEADELLQLAAARQQVRNNRTFFITVLCMFKTFILCLE